MTNGKARRTRSRLLSNYQSVTHSNQSGAHSRLQLQQIVANSKNESGANRVGSDSRHTTERHIYMERSVVIL